ncbi:hypothetical protein LMG28614_05653 [Paraburkholderia ultramafica]|uniref:Stability/partitioning determinant n=1 Tax=Paraburkholderia ultramafica TaxID=1544867 RepID=A0A6S7BJI7_9BURK|nr:stability/partitioning determinant [Paraburkholderia ultramafica]CAB3802594.1 hypothetical protein LMG28614_05653 [Paraburkholderia ultramafica]
MSNRANPLASLDDDPLANLTSFQPKAAAEPRSAEEKRAIEQTAKERGFVSRKAEPIEPVPDPEIHRPRYFRNGRNEPLNFKVTKECKEHLHRLRDDLDQPLGVILEEALNALEAIKPEVIARLRQGSR